MPGGGMQAPQPSAFARGGLARGGTPVGESFGEQLLDHFLMSQGSPGVARSTAPWSGNETGYARGGSADAEQDKRLMRHAVAQHERALHRNQRRTQLELRRGGRSAFAQGGDEGEPEVDPPDPGSDPATECMNQDQLEKFRASVAQEIAGDKLVEGIFSCLEAEITKPHEMAEVLDVKVKDINNGQKRLRRKVGGLLKNSHKR